MRAGKQAGSQKDRWCQAQSPNGQAYNGLYSKAGASVTVVVCELPGLVVVEFSNFSVRTAVDRYAAVASAESDAVGSP